MSVTILRDLRATFAQTRDQGCRPTCLAFAVSDAHAASFSPFRPFSVEYLNYYAVQRMAGRDPTKGVSVGAISDALLHDGQPLEDAWPYLAVLPSDLSRWTPPSGCQVNRRAIKWANKTFPQICDSIDQGYPVVLGLRISRSFLAPNPIGIVQQIPNDPEAGRHAMIAVGYGETGARRCVLVRNSWGARYRVDRCLCCRQRPAEDEQDQDSKASPDDNHMCNAFPIRTLRPGRIDARLVPNKIE